MAREASWHPGFSFPTSEICTMETLRRLFTALQKRRVCAAEEARSFCDLTLAHAAGGWVVLLAVVGAAVGASPSKRGREKTLRGEGGKKAAERQDPLQQARTGG